MLKLTDGAWNRELDQANITNGARKLLRAVISAHLNELEAPTCSMERFNELKEEVPLISIDGQTYDFILRNGEIHLS